MHPPNERLPPAADMLKAAASCATWHTRKHCRERTRYPRGHGYVLYAFVFLFLISFRYLTCAICILIYIILLWPRSISYGSFLFFSEINPS